MKKIILLWSVLGLSPGLAMAVPVLQGDFIVTEQYTIEVHRRYETVAAVNEAGVRRLEELKAEGYECLLRPRNIYQCSKFMKDLDLHPEVLDRFVHDQWYGLLISLRTPLGEPALVYNSEVFKQWEIPQKSLVRLTDGSDPLVFTQTIYTQSGDLWKLYLTAKDQNSSYFFLMHNFEMLEVNDTLEVENGNQRDLYNMTIFVQRLN